MQKGVAWDKWFAPNQHVFVIVCRTIRRSQLLAIPTSLLKTTIMIEYMDKLCLNSILSNFIRYDLVVAATWDLIKSANQ